VPLPDGPSPFPRSGRWAERPAGSTWGDFGPDDVLGRLNLMGPEQVRRGVAEVADGHTFCLSLPLDQPLRPGRALSPHRLPPVVRPTVRAGLVNFHCDLAVTFPGASDVVSDDLVVLHTQFSTQWDAFGHVGARFDADRDGVDEVVYYNGWRAGGDVRGPSNPDTAGATSLGDLAGIADGAASSSDAGPVGISHMAEHGVQGRAVLLDLRHHLGDARQAVGGTLLQDLMRADGIELQPGDVLLLHTGLGEAVLNGGELDGGAVLDGGDAELQEWVRSSGVAAIAADNHAVEAFPAIRHRPGDPVLPLHELCLFRLGVHLGELWWLGDLARHLRQQSRHAFLLTAPPLRLPGATGSPVTPIATT